MICPMCKTVTKVIDSRRTGYRTKRRRICPECGHDFWTIEILRDEDEPAKHKTSPCGNCRYVYDCNVYDRRQGKLMNYECFTEVKNE